MEGSPAPQSVMELLACSCTRSCQQQTCTCIANGLKCSEMCKLKSCTNQPVEEEDESDIVLSSDDEIDELEY